MSGTPITEAKTTEDWVNTNEPAYCWYKDYNNQ